jgi:hypothetical protein
MKTFSTNAASLLLEKDRRTVTKAMLGVTPDARVNGQARWRLRKFVEALSAHEHPSNVGPLAQADKIEAGFSKLEGLFASLQDEPNFEKRRELATKIDIAKTINDLDQLMLAANEADKQLGSIMQLASDKLVGGAVSRLIDLCQCWDDAELYRAAS